MTSLTQKYIHLGTDTLCHWHIDTVNSTQDYAKEALAHHPSLLLITTRDQTQGRGQGGKRWHSQANTNITFTLSLPMPTQPIGYLVSQICTEICLTLEKELQQTLQIKWPNDLFFQGKKLGGILIETYRKHLLIGVGINVMQTKFDIHAPYQATSMKLITDQSYDLSQLELALATRLCQTDFSSEGIPTAYYQRLMGYNTPISIRYKDEEHLVTIEQVSPQGTIELCIDNQRISLHHGEFKFVI